jgi:hypothetical protein
VLIDDRVPPFSAEPGRSVWEPDWRVWSWVLAALAAAAGCWLTAGLASFVLLCAVVGCAAEALSRTLPYGQGLREHRQ